MIRKKLSIIIPYHNEPENLIYDLFSSINSQINIDFNDIEVIVSNNANDPIKPTCFKNFSNLNIKYMECPIKNSVGASRQFAIDNCTGLWCIICDCDDILYSPLTIHAILQDTSTDKYDMIYYKEYIEESPNNFIEYGTNLVLVHGKAYRVDYLKLNNIRFHDYLYFGADVYFSLLLDGTLPRNLKSDTIIYIWRYNKYSISHNDKFDTDSDKIEGLKRTYLVYNKIKKLYFPDIVERLTNDIFWAFYLGWQTINKFQTDGKEREFLLGSQILSLSVETIDPDHITLSSINNIDDEDDKNNYINFINTAKSVYANLPEDFIERNQLWI